MKFSIFLACLLLFFIFIGFPYKFEKQYFINVDEGVDEVQVLIWSSQKKSNFAGVTKLNGAPYNVSISCATRENCLPDINKIYIQSKELMLEFNDINIFRRNNMANQLSERIVFLHEFNVDEKITVIIEFSDEHERPALVSNFLFKEETGFSTIPLWVYITH